jgi:hypothetical protein
MKFWFFFKILGMYTVTLYDLDQLKWVEIIFLKALVVICLPSRKFMSLCSKCLFSSSAASESFLVSPWCLFVRFLLQLDFYKVPLSSARAVVRLLLKRSPFQVLADYAVTELVRLSLRRCCLPSSIPDGS